MATTETPETTVDVEHEVHKVSAIARLAFAREAHPDLRKAEAEARVNLAAAIMAMDSAYDLPGQHDLNEQMLVERTKHAYAQALANLVRGEAG
jgi:hypothetical protein